MQSDFKNYQSELWEPLTLCIGRAQVIKEYKQLQVTCQQGTQLTSTYFNTA